MRLVKVCSISLPGMEPCEDRLTQVLERASKWIDLASKDEPDIICLPESMNGLGLWGEAWAKSAEPVPGPTTEMASRMSRELSTYIVCPIVRRESDGLHNSALLYDRSGRMVAAYDKVHPTIWEIQDGIKPGRQGLVYKADFGRIGFAICFDLNFQNLREFYRRNAVEIIFFPSMFRGGIQLRLWAFELGCYVVSATPGEMSAIVNPLGRILEESYEYNRTISRQVNLDCRVLHLDFNSEKLEAVKKAYGTRVEFEVASPEGIFLLASNDALRTSEDIIKEFGLETRSTYFKRAERIRRDALRMESKSTLPGP